MVPVYKVIQVYPNGSYGNVRISKNVLFDINIGFKAIEETNIPNDSDFNIAEEPIISENNSEQNVNITPPENNDDTFVERFDDDGYVQYWHQITHEDKSFLDNHKVIIESVFTILHHQLLSLTKISDDRIPKTFYEAWHNPPWQNAIMKEINKLITKNLITRE